MATAAIERPLTETEYSKRRAALARDLDAAKEASRKAQLKLVQGDIGDEEAEALEAEASRIERRLTGLDQAWNESERIFSEESNAAHREARSKAVVKIRDHVARRLGHFRQVDAAILALSSTIDAIFEDEAAILAELEPFRRDLSMEESTDLIRAIRSHSREADVLRNSLTRSGLQRLGVVPNGPPGGYTFDNIEPWQEASIHRHLDRLAGEQS